MSERCGAWPSQRTKDSQEWGGSQAESLWENLYARYNPAIEGSTVLDLGCSWGYLLKFLAERFHPERLIGTDVSPWWETRDHGWDYGALGERLHFHVGDLPDIRHIPERSIDLVLCSSVLQYMTPEQVEANLVRAYDLLRPGGEMILRTRVWTSYIGADLHREIELPCVHLMYGEREIQRFLEERGSKRPTYLNWLTASTYLALFVRSGFEVLDVRRRMNKVPPEVRERVEREFPWIAPDELHCAEVEARLLRPLEVDDLMICSTSAR